MHVRTLRFEAREDKDEIVVEIWKLVQLLQFLQAPLREATVHATQRKLTHPSDTLCCCWRFELIHNHNQSQAAHDNTPSQLFVVTSFGTQAFVAEAKSHTFVSRSHYLSFTHTHTHIYMHIFKDTSCTALCVAVSGDWESLSS